MQFNYYFLKQLSSALEKILKGMTLVSCFSQNRNEAVFEFRSDESFFIKATLDGPISLLSFPKEFARARKNSVDLFDQIIDHPVVNVNHYLNERAFSIELTNDIQIVFKLFGRMSNILISQNDQTKWLFKNQHIKDLDIKPSTLDRAIDQSDRAILSADFNLRKLYPTFDKKMHEHLQDQNFDAQSNEQKLNLLKNLLDELNSSRFYVTSSPERLPALTLLRPDVSSTNFTDPIEASNIFASEFLREYHFRKKKDSEIQSLTTQITKCQSYIRKTEDKLRDIREMRRHDEVANILMANLHQTVRQDQRIIELYDFYHDQNIKIKINPSISLQRNAENFYRKAKNQTIEIDKLHSNIKAKSDALKQLQHQLDMVFQATNAKELKHTEASKNSKRKAKEITPLPYYSQKVDGWDIWIGKNAKNNDLMTLKFANKNDLWLHAKDVPGSHVVIKSAGGDSYPKDLIEKVAQIAAWHSKRKHDTLCPVIYTLKKYVNKPKGFPPGMVKLLQEKVVLVKPDRLTQ